MKKNILLLVFLATQINFLAAQSTVGVSVAYGFPSSSQLINSDYKVTTSSSATTTQENGIYGTYGTGFVVAGTYGYSFSKTLGFDATVLYLMGKEYKGSSSSVTNNVQGASSSYSSQAHGFFFNPSIVFTLDRESIKPYIKAGFSVGQIVTEYNNKNTPPPTSSGSVSEVTRKFTGGVPFGITGAIGLDIPIATKFTLFSELNFTSMSSYPKKSEITKYTQNGVDQLSTLSDKIKNTEFKRQITSTGSANEPNQQLSQSFPMGSIRVSVGVKLRLGN